MEQATPHCIYRLPDTELPLQVLHTCALMYVAEQLDHGAMVFVALWEDITNQRETSRWDLIGKCHAYRFCVGREAWEQFTGSLGIDGDRLVRENHRGSFLELIEDRILAIAPSWEQLAPLLGDQAANIDGFQTVDQMAAGWQRLLNKVLHR